MEEIEQMNSLFQQKQRELVLAVSKVEELTRQLEMLKNGRIDGYHDNQSAVAELDRLYKELQVVWRVGSWLGGFLPNWEETPCPCSEQSSAVSEGCECRAGCVELKVEKGQNTQPWPWRQFGDDPAFLFIYFFSEYNLRRI